MGVVNIRISDVLDLELGGHGRHSHPSSNSSITNISKFVEMLTLDLKRSNDNLVVHGKLIIYLSTNTSQPITNPGPTAAGGALSQSTSSSSVVSPTQLSTALTNLSINNPSSASLAAHAN